MAVLVSDVGNREDRLSIQRALDTDAILVACRELVIVHRQAGDVRGVDGPARCGTACEGNTRVDKLNAVQSDAQAERNIGAGVVHVVALNALVHHAEAAADNSLASAGEVVGKSYARTKGCPVIVDQALRNAVLPGDADSIQVERDAR